jgi:hypothetical protein
MLHCTNSTIWLSCGTEGEKNDYSSGTGKGSEIGMKGGEERDERIPTVLGEGKKI